jgi:hypothetical protein
MRQERSLDIARRAALLEAEEKEMDEIMASNPNPNPSDDLNLACFSSSLSLSKLFSISHFTILDLPCVALSRVVLSYVVLSCLALLSCGCLVLWLSCLVVVWSCL